MWLFESIRIEFPYVVAMLVIVALVPIVLSWLSWKARKMSAPTAVFIIASYFGSLLLMAKLCMENPGSSDNLSPFGIVIVVSVIGSALAVLGALPLGIPALAVYKFTRRKPVQVLGCAEHLPSVDELAPHVVAPGSARQSIQAKSMIVMVTLLSAAGWGTTIMDGNLEVHKNSMLRAVAQLTMKITMPLQRHTKFPPPDH